MKHACYALLPGAFLALAVPAAAQEHVKAEYVQEHVSCKEIGGYAKGGECYRCPEGYKRNLRAGPYTRIKACTVDMDKEALKARWEKGKNDRPDTRSRTEAVLRGYEANYNDPNGGGQGLENLTPALNVLRRDEAIEILSKEAEEEEDPYTTVVWTSESGLSAAIGFSFGTGFAIHRTDEQDADGNWMFECQQVNVPTFQLGPLAEVGFGDSVSLEQGNLDAVPGRSNGYFVAAGVFAYGGMLGQKWCRDTGARAFAWGLGMGKGGAGAAWGWTRTTAKDTFDCDQIEKTSEPD